MTRVRISILAAGAATLIALSAAACGDITENGDPDKNGNGDARNAAEVHDDPAALDGRTFVSTEVAANGDTPRYLRSAEIELSFEKSARRIEATVGCNGMFGELSANDGILSIDGLARTEMGCAEPLMKQEEWLASLLESEPAWELTEQGRLRIRSAGTEVLLAERRQDTADGSAAIRDVTWKLDGVAEADAGPNGTVRHSRAMQKTGLSFTAGPERGDDRSGRQPRGGDEPGDDRGERLPGDQRSGKRQPGERGADQVKVEGTSGCNGFGGQAVIMPKASDADSQRPTKYDGIIEFGRLTSTMKACSDDAVMRIEQQMLGTMNGKVPYELSEDTLTLYGDEYELTFSAH